MTESGQATANGTEFSAENDIIHRDDTKHTTERAMRRYGNIKEFGDQPWLKGWLRDFYRDCLNAGIMIGGQYRHLHIPFKRWADKSSATEVLEIGSGGAGPCSTLLQASEADGIELPKIILSDIRPSLKAYEDLQRRFGATRVSYIRHSVAAEDAGDQGIPHVMILSALHHLPSDTVKKLLEVTLAKGHSIFIAEPFPRDLRHFMLVLLSGPLPYMLAPFVAERFTWKRFLLCTLVPLFPLMVMIDGCISVLRVYSKSDLQALLPEKVIKGYEVEFGTLRYLGVFRATYCTISRKRTADTP